MRNISDYLGELIGKLLTTEQRKFSKILITRDVILDIIDFAKTNYPKEFVAVLEGKVIDDSLVIDGILYQPFQASNRAAVMRQDLPLTTKSIGTVHSHPTPNNIPSGQDIRLFNRGGIVHMIIAYPFIEQSLACYDLHGRTLHFQITS